MAVVVPDTLTEITQVEGFREDTIDMVFDGPWQVNFTIVGLRADDPPLDIRREWTYTRNGITLVTGYIKKINQKLTPTADDQTYVLMDRYGDLNKELLLKYGTTRFTLNPDRLPDQIKSDEFKDFNPIWTVDPIPSGYFQAWGGPNVLAENADQYENTVLSGVAANIKLENLLYNMFIQQNQKDDTAVTDFISSIGNFLIPDTVDTFKKAIEFFLADSDVIIGQTDPVTGIVSKVLWFNDTEGILDTPIENNINFESRFIGEIIEEFMRYVPTVRFYYSAQLKQLVAVNLKAGAGKVVRLNRMFTNFFERHQQQGTPYSDVIEVNVDTDESSCYQSIHLEGSGHFAKVTNILTPQFPVGGDGSGCDGSLYSANLVYDPAYTYYGKKFKFPTLPSAFGFDDGKYGSAGDVIINAMVPFASNYLCTHGGTRPVNINRWFFAVVQYCNQKEAWFDFRWFKLYNMAAGDLKLDSNGEVILISPQRLMHAINFFGVTTFGPVGDVLNYQYGDAGSPNIPCLDYTAGEIEITNFDGSKGYMPRGPHYIPWVLSATYWEKRGPLSVFVTGGCFNGRTFSRFNQDWGFAVVDDKVNHPTDQTDWPCYGYNCSKGKFRAPTYKVKDGYPEFTMVWGGLPVAGMPNSGVQFTAPVEAQCETIQPDQIFYGADWITGYWDQAYGRWTADVLSDVNVRQKQWQRPGQWVANTSYPNTIEWSAESQARVPAGYAVLKDDREAMAKFAANLADVLFIPKISGSVKIHLFPINAAPAVEGYVAPYDPPLEPLEVNPLGNFGESWALGDRLSIEYDVNETQGPGEVPNFAADVNVDPLTWDKMNISVVGLHYNRQDQSLVIDIANSAFAYGDRILEGLQR